VNGYRSVRVACVGLLALGLLVAGSASSSAAGDLHISLAATPPSPVAGGAAFTVSADVSNNSGTDVNSYIADIVLPSGISFVSSNDGCAPDSGDAQMIVCPRGATPDGTGDSFAFAAIAASSAAGPATITPSVVGMDPATVTGSGDGLSLTVDGQADLASSISAPGGDQIAGDPAGFDYAVSVKNNGPSDNTGGYTVTGTLPAGVSFVSGTGCATATGGFTCSDTALAAGATKTFTVHVTAASSTAPGTPNAHVAVVSNGTSDPNSANDAADTSPDVSIITRADLAPTITAPVGDQIAGDPAGLDYAVSVTNNGLSDNTGGYTVTGTLPAGVSFVSGTGCATATGGFTCSDTGLAAGATKTFTVHVTVASSTPPGSPNAHVAVVSNGTADPTSANDAADTNPDVSIITQADLASSISAPGGSQIAGDPAGFDYAVSVKNNGLSDNTGGYTVTGTLPSGVSFASGTGCVTATGGFTCSDTGLAAGATKTFTVHVAVASSTPAGSPNAHVSVASTGTTDPNAANNDADTNPDVTIITRADLQASISAPGGSQIAGDPAGFNYTVQVKNNGFSDNTGGYTVTGTLPSGVSFASGTGCVTATGGFTCSNATGLVSGATDTYTVHVTVAASTPDGTPNAHVSVASTGTTDPSAANNDADTSPDVTIITRADLVITGSGDSASAAPSVIFANATPGQNTVSFSVTFHNAGLSDGRHSTLKFDPSLSTHLGSAEWCLVTLTDPCGASSTFTAYNATNGVDVGQLKPHDIATVMFHAHALAADRNGPFNVAQGFRVSVPGPTTDPDLTNNARSANSIEIDTVPSPVRNVQAVPGNGNAIVTWEPPSNTGGGSQTISQYKVTVTPTGGGSPITVPASAPRVLCPNGVNTDCYRLNISPLTNNTNYTIAVQAQNSVGLSDVHDGVNPDASATARPSVNASAAIVPTNTTSTLSTCTTATPQQPTCVQYLIPSGTGGVFGALGGPAVALPNGFCGGAPCVSNTGSQNFGSLAGYNDPKKPLVLDIKWDASTIGSNINRSPSCGSGKTTLNCYPNDIPIFYEISFTLLNFPTFGATPLNLGNVRHFCADPVSQGGAGNKAWARPKPATGGLPQFNGYTDSAGSACISHFDVLNGKPGPGRPGDKGDVELFINLTSDSDSLSGHH
jgi:uncharacterized repeat protein (TIGR01451 family)